MTGKELKESLRSGRRVYGTLIVSTSPKWVDVINQLNLDFVFIDTEHIPIDRHQLSWMCHAYAGKGIVPIVRIPSPDPYQASMVIDGGANGIVAPYVESKDEVIKLVGAVKKKPVKGEKLNNCLTSTQDFEDSLNRYVEEKNANSLLIVNIESTPAIENIDEIVNTPGLDAVLIGPHDLSCSLGIPEQYHHPDFIKAVDFIIQKARSAGIGAGIHVTFGESIKSEVRWGKKGANFILHGADIIGFIKQMNADLNAIRTSLDDNQGTSHGDISI